MNDSKISVRYAKALFNLAVENNILELIKTDVDLLLEICKIEDFKEFLHSPIIPISKKQKIFKGIFSGSVNQYVVDFLLLLAKSRREVYLEIISLDFLKYYRDFLGIKQAELTTASAITEKSKEQFIQMLSRLLESKIDIKHKINENIIGGFVLRIDEKQIDASVKTQLQDFKKELVK